MNWKKEHSTTITVLIVPIMAGLPTIQPKPLPKVNI